MPEVYGSAMLLLRVATQLQHIQRADQSKQIKLLIDIGLKEIWNQNILKPWITIEILDSPGQSQMYGKPKYTILI